VVTNAVKSSEGLYVTCKQKRNTHFKAVAIIKLMYLVLFSSTGRTSVLICKVSVWCIKMCERNGKGCMKQEMQLCTIGVTIEAEASMTIYGQC